MLEQRRLAFRDGLLPGVYLPLLLLLCWTLSWHPLDSSSDFWAHAAVGRWIWQHGTVPHQTLFLWSVEPTPWIAHSWLTQLLFYGFMATGEAVGPYVSLAFTAIVVAAMYGMIWRLWAKHSPVTTLMAALFALTIMRGFIRYNPRPELFSGLGLTCLMVLLVYWAPAASASIDLPVARRQLLITACGLPLLFLAWTNLHGGMVMGLIVLGATVLCDFVQDRADKRARTLGVISLLCLAVVLINPYGFAYWQALQSVGGPVFQSIEEWRPLWDLPQPSEGTIILQGGLAIVAVVAWRLNPQRRAAHLAWMILMALAYVTARRNGWLLGLTSLIVMAANAQSLQTTFLWQTLWPGLAEKEQARTGNPGVPLNWRRIGHGAMVIALVLAILYDVPERKPVLPPVAQSPQLATNMAGFLQRNYQNARLFNDYETSSYLHWRFAGRPPLFIDLLNAYPADLAMRYGEIADFTPEGIQRLDELNIQVIALGSEPQQRYLSRLQQFLDANSNWVKKYNGADGSIWVRSAGT